MDKQYRLGFIGYGGMAGWHHQNLVRAPKVIPYGVYDINPARVKAGVEKGLVGYESSRALLSDPKIDMVLIATPNNFHAEYSIAAMRAGKHVICEKPVTMNSMELKQVMEVSRETGMQFSIHQNRRWDKDYLTVRKAIEEDMIGEPYLIKSYVLGSRGIPEGWRTHKVAGGGMMLDWGVHLIDQMLQMIGKPVVKVFARMQHLNFTEVDDGFTLTLEFENGPVAMVEVDTASFISQGRWHVRGSNGTLCVDNWDAQGKIIRAKDMKTQWEEEIVYTSAGPTKTMAPRSSFTSEELPLPKISADWMQYYHNYVAALEGKEPLFVKPEEAMRVMLVMEAAFESERCGQAVEFRI